jgi:hypothetical protein
MSHVSVQVIAPVLTNFFHCMHCEQLFDQAGIGRQMHQEELEQYPADVKEEAARLANWLFGLAHRYGDQIHIRVIDPQSLEGFFLSLRYWARHYPTFIVNGQKASVGWDRDGLEQVLQAHLAQSHMGAAKSQGGLHGEKEY